MKILSIDPSGTGTSGMFFTNGTEQEFFSYENKNWKEHYSFIKELVQNKKPNLIIYEHTNYINLKGIDMTSLFKLFGAIECLEVERINNIPVNQVKELAKKLLKGELKLAEIEYQQGRGKGWMFEGKRISIHCLEAFIVYYLWKDKEK